MNSSKHKSVFVRLAIEHEPNPTERNPLRRFALLAQFDVAGNGGLLASVLYVVERAPMPRVLRTRAETGELDRTLRPFRSRPEPTPKHPIGELFYFGRDLFKIRTQEFWK